MKRKVTLVWDHHGGGCLVGIFDDALTIQTLQRQVAESGEEAYVRFSVIKVNEVLSASFRSRSRASQ